MQAEHVIINFSDNTNIIFEYEAMRGGDPLQVTVENPFIIIVDTFHKVFYYPSDQIKAIKVSPLRR